MQRKYIFIGFALIAILIFVGFATWGSGSWDHTSVTRVVPGENGETLVITDAGRADFVPFFPFFLFAPVIWFLVISGVFSFLGHRRWHCRPAYANGPQDREAWLQDWHARQHDNVSPTPNPSGSNTDPTASVN